MPRTDDGRALTMAFAIRLARMEDIPALTALIQSSVRELQKGEYSQAQREAALGSVFGVDRRLVEDGTYYVAEFGEVEFGEAFAGCGGWSRRRTLFGSDQWHGREDSLLDPARDAAKIRAFFVHPDFARRGVASMILESCEAAAKEHGFTRLEMGATLTGVPFYRSRGYVESERMEAELPGGGRLAIVRMSREI
jgi:GNAT superfamily N-acetyltransferase